MGSRRLVITPVALALVGLGVAGGVAEIALRLVDPDVLRIHRLDPIWPDGRPFFMWDADLGWRGRPGAVGRFDGTEFRTRVVVNSRGFRDRERIETKPPGRLRVAVFGDSITWGYGVEQTERFTDRLEAAGLAGRAAEVLNLGVNGYGTDQELLLYRAVGRRYCPDLVLVTLYANDVTENESATQSGYAKPLFRLADGRLRLTNAPVDRQRMEHPEPQARGSADNAKSWLRSNVRLYAAKALARQALAGLWTHPAAHAAVPESAVSLTAALLSEFEREVVDGGAYLAVALVPDRSTVLARSAAPTPIARALARSGVRRTIDLTPALRALAPRERAGLYYVDNGAHPTRDGHARIAEILTPFLAASLPPQPGSCR